MKRITLTLLILVLWTGTSFGRNLQDPSASSGEQTSDGAVATIGGYIAGVEIITDGTNDVKLILYDNASAASGTVLFEGTVLGGSHFGGRVWSYPVIYDNGIYADITGTGASYIVEYIDR